MKVRAGAGFALYIMGAMDRVLWTKVYRLFESLLVSITVRTAMATL